MTRRLLLSYLAVIALTVALLAIIVQWVTAQTFSRYLSDQAAAHSEMLPVMLAGYYTKNGAWEGVQPDIDQASVMIGAQVALADADRRIVAASQRELIGQQVDEALPLGLAIPVAGSGGVTVGTAYVERSLAQQRADAAFLTGVTRALVIAGLAVALLATGLGVLLARSISRPLAEMSQAAGRIAQGDYAVRVPVRGRDEVTALAGAFNRMAEGMSSVEQLRRELVANVSHDLRTPLTVIRGYLEGLRSGEIADRRSAEMAFEAMHTEVARLLHLVGDLRQTAALDSGALLLNRRPITARALASEAIDRITPLAATKGIHLRSQVPAELPPLNIDAERLGQALFNLLENAVRHTPAGGTIEITAQRHGEHLHLIVQDNGTGIPAEHLPHIFERFYRADRARNPAEGRAGLGLSIVKSIVEAHGGVVKAESEGMPGKGSAFTISLPLPTFPE